MTVNNNEKSNYIFTEREQRLFQAIAVTEEKINKVKAILTFLRDSDAPRTQGLLYDVMFDYLDSINTVKYAATVDMKEQEVAHE